MSRHYPRAPCLRVDSAATAIASRTAASERRPARQRARQRAVEGVAGAGGVDRVDLRRGQALDRPAVGEQCAAWRRS